VIRGARIADGTGNPAFFGDVSVREGRIVEVGRVAAKGKTEVDATGLVLAPGFIDVHAHAEDVAERPRAENFVRMGVTTIVTGNCGSSQRDIGRFLARLDAAPASLNVATLVGHNTVRREAMGGEFDRPPTPEELERMKALVDAGMRGGAAGFSTGLIYTPGTYSKTDEIIELAKAAAPYDGIYVSHMRNERSGIFDALAELFRIAREAKLRAQVSHIKLGGPSAWGRSAEVLAAIERARAEGLDVTQDQYVYTASATSLTTLVPSSAREGGTARLRERLDDPEQKAQIIAQMRKSLESGGYKDYSYAVIANYRPDPSLNGKTIVEAARLKRGKDSLEDQIELILEIARAGGGGGVFHGMNEDDLQAFLRHPNTMVAADGGIQSGAGVPHPRSYGNTARLLGRYVRELKVLRLEDAVRKLTSLPASTFRLRDRGVIRPGAAADLVAFDPAKVADVARFGDPHHFAAGIPHVWVNGTAVVRNGEHTGAQPGTALRHQPTPPEGSRR
jgi:N-acyl-D-amino-acid deacylase